VFDKNKMAVHIHYSCLPPLESKTEEKGQFDI